MAWLIAPAVAFVVARTLGGTALDLPGQLPAAWSGALAWAWGLGVPALTVIAALAGALGRRCPGGLRVGGQESALAWATGGGRTRSATVEGALLVRLESSAALDLHLDGGRVLRVETTEEEASAVLERLGFGPSRRRVTVPLGSEALPLFAGCGVFILGLLLALTALVAATAIVQPTGWAATALLAVLGTFVAAAPVGAHRLAAGGELVVGNDGVLVRVPGETRHLPFAAIRRTFAAHDTLVLVLGPAAPGACEEQIVLYGTDPAVMAGLSARIEAGLRAPPALAARATAELAPGRRSLAEWRAALTRAMRGEGRYRSAALRVDDVTAVLEDGRAEARLRVGAALALRAADGDEGRARVRVAAAGCADEELRAALEEAAGEEPEERALARVLRR